MFEEQLGQVNWLYFLLAATGVTCFGLRWLTKGASRPGSAGWVADVVIPLILTSASLTFLPQVMSAFGVARDRYSAAFESAMFQAVWLGVLFDQSSWVHRTTEGLRGRRSALPVWLWGCGFVVFMLAPLASRCQVSVLAAIEASLLRAEQGAAPEKLNLDLNQYSSLVSDWSLRVAEFGIALTMVGALAMVGQMFIWILRITFSYFAGEAEPLEAYERPAHAPGCFQTFFGFLLGIVGTIWLVCSTIQVLQGP